MADNSDEGWYTINPGPRAEDGLKLLRSWADQFNLDVRVQVRWKEFNVPRS